MDRGEHRGERGKRALRRYREAARERGEAAACLIDGARQRSRSGAHERRRAALVERAVAESGLSWSAAEAVYVLACSEGVEPALAFELVHCGVLVRPSAQPRDPAEGTLLEARPPDWLSSRQPDADVRREAAIRASLRRLRGLLEAHDDPEAALVAYAQEPDILGRHTGEGDRIG